MARFLILILVCAPLQAQSALRPLPWRLLGVDGKSLASAPAEAKRHWKWIVPAAGGIAWLVATDARNMSERLHPNEAARNRSASVSNVLTAGFAGLPLYLSWRGWHDGDRNARSAGLHSIQAAADSVMAIELLRLAAGRERPDVDGGRGRFEHGSRFEAGFPSMHSAVAWSVASVIARRYPGWLGTVGAYGAAATVSAARVLAAKHYPSDVVVGSLLGFSIGRYVDRDPAPAVRAEPRERTPAPAGTVYVPLESWIYGSLERLAAMGLIPSQTSGLRPWTRAECRRQMAEADTMLESARAVPKEPRELLSALHREFGGSEASDEGIVLESVYVRNGVIAGPVLNDSFHFGQTWSNDSGRPFGRGWNSYEGFTARAQSGRFFAYVQGEYQHAPGAEPTSFAVRQTISQLDSVPLQAAGSGDATNRFRTLDTYVGARLGDLQISVGKQSMWWGPTYDAPLSFSNNAEPTKNLKASLVDPIRLPGVFRHLGEIRGEFVIGKLGGQAYTWRPWFNAQKLSFKLTENLELGFTRWSIFWGVGHPITAGTFLRNFTSTNSPLVNGVGRSDPGDRKGGFDFRYRVPGLRRWITLYTDSYCDDDPSPLAAPRRAAINPGIHFTQIPGIPRLDVRVEAPSTKPLGWDMGGNYNYVNSQYLSGNSNYGQLLGNSVGRDGRAVEAVSAYKFSARNKVEAQYRQSKASSHFLAGGGTQTDAALKTSTEIADRWHLDATIQYERFWIPLLGGRARNRSAVVQFTWEPRPDSFR
jgi:membrane-associated phospholipid phosphatase